MLIDDLDQVALLELSDHAYHADGQQTVCLVRQQHLLRAFVDDDFSFGLFVGVCHVLLETRGEPPRRETCPDFFAVKNTEHNVLGAPVRIMHRDTNSSNLLGGLALGENAAATKLRLPARGEFFRTDKLLIVFVDYLSARCGG